jgi:hypothetical protein
MPLKRFVIRWSEHVGDAVFEGDDRYSLSVAIGANDSNRGAVPARRDILKTINQKGLLVGRDQAGQRSANVTLREIV